MDLLLISAVILLCILLNKLTARLGIPMLLAFIGLGMVFGSDGLLKVPFESLDFAQQVCTAALIIIMFYGGFGTSWSRARPVALKAGLLSSLGVVMTAALVGLFCRFALGFPTLESFLVGSVVSSTDAATVFSLLRSKRLNLKNNTASLLELESGSNDPCAYMLTLVLLSVMTGRQAGHAIAYTIFAQLAYGAAFGVAIACAALYFLRKFSFDTVGFDTVFVLAVAILAYAAPTAVGGNGYLSTYIVGIILGNRRIANKKELTHFFDAFTGLTQMLIFFLLGLLSSPSRLPAVLLPAVLIALFLTFVARPAAVFSLLSPLRCSFRQQLLVSWAGLRGAASIVFAIIAALSSASFQNDIFHIVFLVVLLSIAFQGSLLPYVARKLQMIDDSADVLKTFTDYSEEIPVQYMDLNIPEGHAWAGQAVRDILFPPDSLLVLVIRDGEQLIPRGKTVILAGDKLVLSAPAVSDALRIRLTEIGITKSSEWNGKRIADMPGDADRLVMLIKRGKKIIIPSGNTRVQENDILVISGGE